MRWAFVAFALVSFWSNHTNAGTIAYWRFEDGASLSAADSSGNGHVGTLQGGATFSSTVPLAVVPQNGLPNADALLLNGTSSYVSVVDVTSLHPASAFTLEAWLMRTGDFASFAAAIVGRQYAFDNRNSYNLAVRNNNTTAFVEATNSTGTDAAAETAFSLPLNEWFHFAGVFDGSELRFYIDGDLKASTVFAGPIGYGATNSTDALLIGADNDGAGVTFFFRGYLDEVRISDVALPPNKFLNAVPEPSALLVWSGLAGLAALRRRLSQRKGVLYQRMFG